jgi:hypothetical protein
MSLLSVTTLPEKSTFNSPLNNNVLQNITLDTQLPEAIEYTQPYWQKKEKECIRYKIKKYWNSRCDSRSKSHFNIGINGVEIPFERTVVYKYNDNVKGNV